MAVMSGFFGSSENSAVQDCRFRPARRPRLSRQRIGLLCGRAYAGHVDGDGTCQRGTEERNGGNRAAQEVRHCFLGTASGGDEAQASNEVYNSWGRRGLRPTGALCAGEFR
jgi:hypothetical protein